MGAGHVFVFLEREADQSDARGHDGRCVSKGASEGAALWHGHAHRRLHPGYRSRGRSDQSERNISLKKVLGALSFGLCVLPGRAGTGGSAHKVRSTKYQAQSTNVMGDNITVYEKPTCTKCREMDRFLRESSVDFSKIN